MKSTLLNYFCLFLLLSSTTGFSQENLNKPNVIYILADDLGYGDVKRLNASAQVNTPNIDRLVNEGAAFTNAHSGSAVCTPTRYGILTGRYAFRSTLKKGVLNGYSPALIEENRYTIAHLAKAAGYQTAIIGKWHLGLNWSAINASKKAITPGTDQYKPDLTNVNFNLPVKTGPNQNGFDYSYIIPASLDMPPYAYLENGKPTHLPLVPFKGSSAPRGVSWREGIAAENFEIEKTLDVFIAKAKDYVMSASKKKEPFFLYLPLTSPHTPWLPSKQFKSTSKAGTYGDFVQHTDDAVGRILKTLDSLGIAKNTLVVFTSDNGADWKPSDELAYPLHHANYIFKGEKSDIWEGGHHVPFIMRWPSVVKSNSTISQITCLTDFMSTFAAITKQKLPADAGPDSFNLLPALMGSNKMPRESIIHHSIDGMFAIRKGKWKFIDGKGSGGWSMKVGKPEDPEGQLYDMENDERETKNLYDKYPMVVKELKVLLEKQKQQGFSK